jgi:hypothetical protein
MPIRHLNLSFKSPPREGERLENTELTKMTIIDKNTTESLK